MKNDHHICDISCKFYNSLGCPYLGGNNTGELCDEYQRRKTCLDCKELFNSDCYKECRFFGIITNIEACDFFEEKVHNG